MTPKEFVNKWANSHLGEKQIAQAHFLDVCHMVGVEMPGGDGRTESGDTFVFEQSLKQISGHGFADVYYEGHFAIEYKSPDKYKDLNAAYQQLLKYRENLNNPPLLVVTDVNHWEIHTNFPNTQKRVYTFSHNEIASDAEKSGWLRDMFHAPERLHPRRNTEQITKEAAQVFRLIADNMRDWNAEPRRIAFFLTKLVFCLFAEDVGLLPTIASEPQGIFSYIIEQSRGKPSVFKQNVQNLFVAMNEGGNILMRDIPYFNGTLFNVVTVEELSAEALDALAKAAELNWEAIEPSIFGTLFERSLDPNKRSQLGAHYTSRDDILLIVEPVLMQPLRYAWDTVQLEAEPIRKRYDEAQTGRAKANARTNCWRSATRFSSASALPPCSTRLAAAATSLRLPANADGSGKRSHPASAVDGLANGNAGSASAPNVRHRNRHDRPCLGQHRRLDRLYPVAHTQWIWSRIRRTDIGEAARQYRLQGDTPRPQSFPAFDACRGDSDDRRTRTNPTGPPSMSSSAIRLSWAIAKCARPGIR